MNNFEKKMLFYARLRTALSAVILVAVIAVSVIVVPDLLKVLDSVNEAAGKLGTVAANIEEQTEGLDELISSVTDMVDSNTQGVTDALEKVNSIDFESLNAAIKDLSDVVAPLANIGNMFGR